MSNPVFKRIDRDWKNSVQTQQSQAVPTQGPTYDQQAFDRAKTSYAMPSATAVAMGRMTYDDVIVRTAMNLAVAIGLAAVAWFFSSVNPLMGLSLTLVGFLCGAIFAMINIFSKTIRPTLIVLYSAFEGLGLGALSFYVNDYAPGVVVQAVLATFAVFGVTLALFASGKVRSSPKMMRFVLISLIGIILARLLIWLFSLTGINMGGAADLTVMGMPLGVVISFFAVVIGAFVLIGDFDQVKMGVQHGVPVIYSWKYSFGIMVTLIWLYVEILNILSYLNRN